MDSQLVHYREQMGYRVIPLPARMEVDAYQPYPTGVLMELVEELIKLPQGMAVEMNYEALTNSNVSTMHSNAKSKGYKLHCLRSGNKRIIFLEKRP